MVWNNDEEAFQAWWWSKNKAESTLVLQTWRWSKKDFVSLHGLPAWQSLLQRLALHCRKVYLLVLQRVFLSVGGCQPICCISLDPEVDFLVWPLFWFSISRRRLLDCILVSAFEHSSTCTLMHSCINHWCSFHRKLGCVVCSEFVVTKEWLEKFSMFIVTCSGKKLNRWI